MPNEKNLLAHAPTQPAMPAQPKTVAQPAMTDRAMLEDLYKLNKGQTETLTRLVGDVHVLGGQQNTIISRVNGLEFRIGGVEERLNNNSVRAKQPSEHDLETKAELAKEVVAREALAKVVDKHTTQLDRVEAKTDAQTETLDTIKGAVVGVITNKKVIFVGKTLFVLAVALAGYLKGH